MTEIVTQKMKFARRLPTPAFFLNFEETGSDIASIRDAVQGIVLTANILDTWAENGAGIAIDTETNASYASLSGPPLPGVLDTESALLISASHLATSSTLGSGFGYGASSTSETGFLSSSGVGGRVTSTAFDTNDITNGTALAAGQDRLNAILVDRQGATCKLYEQIGNGAVALVGSTALSTWSAQTVTNALRFGLPAHVNTLTMYSQVLYKWTGPVPADLLDALAWFASQPKAGNKALFSKWNKA